MAVNSTENLLAWIKSLNDTIKVSISKNSLDDSEFWYYDDKSGVIRNKQGSFFHVTGIRQKKPCGEIVEQPVIIQNEIGYLGIICKKIDGEMHYLMQAKIEPGNINKIQISPTIQATKSNFTQKHGGKKPAYLDYFVNASKYRIIVDQIQSEQSSRFYKKRNRNIIIEINDEIEVLSSHQWMTLTQIKELMRIDNLVNMDTRTVLSCIPCDTMGEMGVITDESFKNSINFKDENKLPEVYQYINNYKMFDESETEFVPLYSLKNWHMKNNEFVCMNPYSFKVVFCDIDIEGREVKHWTQPLFESTGIATFGLVVCNDNGVKKFLVKVTPEIGCFDKIELGPTVQREYIHTDTNNSVDDFFDKMLSNKDVVIFDTLLSEEGGRFYCEQNRNVIMQIQKNDIGELPEGYFWIDYRTLNNLNQINNCLNIQLRNLLSVLEW